MYALSNARLSGTGTGVGTGWRYRSMCAARNYNGPCGPIIVGARPKGMGVSCEVHGVHVHVRVFTQTPEEILRMNDTESGAHCAHPALSCKADRLIHYDSRFVLIPDSF